jgi:hypothetical protein
LDSKHNGMTTFKQKNYIRIFIRKTSNEENIRDLHLDKTMSIDTMLKEQCTVCALDSSETELSQLTVFCEHVTGLLGP